MLTQKELFFSGFNATWAGSYFQSLDLLRHYVDFNHPVLQQKVAAEIKQLNQRTEDAAARVLIVQSVAEKARIIMMPAPQFPEAFFSWSRMCFSGFGDRLREDSPQGIAFRVGYHSGEILSELQLLVVILQLSTAVPGIPAFESQWKNCSQNLLRALHKLRSSAQMALLVPNGPISLHDHLYVQIGEGFLDIGQADVDFSSIAYLHLLSSKVQTVIREALTWVNRVGEGL